MAYSNIIIAVSMYVLAAFWLVANLLDASLMAAPSVPEIFARAVQAALLPLLTAGIAAVIYRSARIRLNQAHHSE